MTRAEAQAAVLRLLVMTVGARFFLDAVDGLVPTTTMRWLRISAGLVAMVAVFGFETYKLKRGG